MAKKADKLDKQKKEEKPKRRQINAIYFKRKEVKWGLIVRGFLTGNKERKEGSKKKMRLTRAEQETDTYGHWWVEVGPLGNNESYGWWPKQQVGFGDTIKGVEGVLNGMRIMPDGLTPVQEIQWKLDNPEGAVSPTDPHHGDDADEEFYRIVAKDDKRTVSQIVKDLRDFVKPFKAGWEYPAVRTGYENCHTFQEKIIKVCKLKDRGVTVKRKGRFNVSITKLPKDVEEEKEMPAPLTPPPTTTPVMNGNEEVLYDDGDALYDDDDALYENMGDEQDEELF
jgi:hypothetical protein